MVAPVSSCFFTRGSATRGSAAARSAAATRTPWRPSASLTRVQFGLTRTPPRRETRFESAPLQLTLVGRGARKGRDLFMRSRDTFLVGIVGIVGVALLAISVV